jgi:tyrosine-specific transport protein
MNTKAIGGMLLLVGTSLGAGMLALPLALAKVGFFYSVLLSCLCWFVMYLGARFILEVNLTFEPGCHLVSMAKDRLGWPGQLLAWVSCLCLMYSLISSYIAGGSDMLKSLCEQYGFDLPNAVSTVLFTFLFGGIVYAGIRTVDYVNRGLMFGKLAIYLLVVSSMISEVKLPQLHDGMPTAIPDCLMILIVSFGFASIVPSLRYYFRDDIPLLKRVLFWGSLIPLLCYVIWTAIIMGVLPTEGDHSLNALSQSVHPLSGLIQGLQSEVGVGWIEKSFTLFTIICLLTAFLGVSLGLFDFLADGLKLKKRGLQGMGVYTATFIPPMLLVMFKPGIYMNALSYAGRFCVLLLLLLPSLMLFRSKNQTYVTKTACVLVFFFALGLLYVGG